MASELHCLFRANTERASGCPYLERGFRTGLCYVLTPLVDTLAPALVPGAWFRLPVLLCDLRSA